ncbi:MAG: hypothetical protein GXO07_04570 [Crenarchaeota archaeon]|nr:hypothetical protein [Thermoproteota archaeon]
MKGRVIFLLFLPIALATMRMTASVNSLVPVEGGWIAVTDKGLLVLKSVPENATLDMVVKEVCNVPYVKVYVPADTPWACTVEALSLLNKPEPVVSWKSVPLPNLTCGQRYLFSQVLASTAEGNGTTVIYPIDNSICKRVSVDAFVANRTLVIDVKVEKIKPWLDICPPSKVYDVVIAWGNASKVKIIINGKVVLEERGP